MEKRTINTLIPALKDAGATRHPRAADLEDRPLIVPRLRLGLASLGQSVLDGDVVARARLGRFADHGADADVSTGLRLGPLARSIVSMATLSHAGFASGSRFASSNRCRWRRCRYGGVASVSLRSINRCSRRHGDPGVGAWSVVRSVTRDVANARCRWVAPGDVVAPRTPSCTESRAAAIACRPRCGSPMVGPEDRADRPGARRDPWRRDGVRRRRRPGHGDGRRRYRLPLPVHADRRRQPNDHRRCAVDLRRAALASGPLRGHRRHHDVTRRPGRGLLLELHERQADLRQRVAQHGPLGASRSPRPSTTAAMASMASAASARSGGCWREVDGGQLEQPHGVVGHDLGGRDVGQPVTGLVQLGPQPGLGQSASIVVVAVVELAGGAASPDRRRRAAGARRRVSTSCSPALPYRPHNRGKRGLPREGPHPATALGCVRVDERARRASHGRRLSSASVIRFRKEAPIAQE